MSISAGIPRLLCLPVDSVSLEYGVGVNLGWWRGELGSIPRLLCLPVDSVSLEYGVGVNLGWWRGELVPHLPQQYVSLPHQPAQSYDTVIIVQKKKLSGILYIFLSLNSGQVPTEWRTATVIPIFKKGKNQQQQTTARSLSFV